MLDEYKELCRQSADVIPEWTKMTKNDLCRAYVSNKGNEFLQNAYLSAILYRYWNLIGKYYYMSANCATPEECYGWLVDSVSCCVNLASWENPDSSIYNDPNGPDKVINRCMKCARLTYYQFINRKKRKDDFGLLSIDEMKENFGTTVSEPADAEQEFDVSKIIIQEHIVDEFRRKNYFLSFLLYFIIYENVFDTMIDSEKQQLFEFNIRKLCKIMNSITKMQLVEFSREMQLDFDAVNKAYSYVSTIPSGNMKKKITQTLEQLKHSTFVEELRGINRYVD